MVAGSETEAKVTESGGGAPTGEEAAAGDKVADVGKGTKGDGGIGRLDGGGDAWIEFPGVVGGKADEPPSG